MKKITTLSFLFFCFTSTAPAQRGADSSNRHTSFDTERYISVLAGYNGWKYHFAELGIALNDEGSDGHHSYSRAFFISNEMRISKKFLMGPKAGIWIGGGVAAMAIGLNLIYYTDFNEGTLRFRPEIGMGFGKWKVVYGYNVALTNKSFVGINQGNVAVAMLFNLKKIKNISH